MAKMKKGLAVAMACAMTLSMLAGCGSKAEDSDATEVEVSTEAADDTEEAAEVDATEESTTEEATEEQDEGVSDGDVLIDLTFDDQDDVDSCHTYTNGGQCALTLEDGELGVNIGRTGSVDYANQVYYDGFKLYKDCVYEWSFDVRSDIERGLQYRIQINGGDYHPYIMDEISIGTETQHISVTFTMEEDTDPAPRMCMNLGHFDVGDDSAEHNVYFDNIKLVAVDTSNVQIEKSTNETKTVNINQVGYNTDDPKYVTASNYDASSFQVVNVDTGEVVAEEEFTGKQQDVDAGDKCKMGDFSEVTAEGTYKIVLDTGEESYEFKIQDGIYDDLYKSSVLMLYNQRCGTDLDESISGDFAHKACHTGEAIVYGTDTAKEVTGGWHDAGDYGRYVVAGAKAVQDLLLSYEDSEAAHSDDAIGIPESGNGTPDILDEARYELEWMLKMQDETSGGVYHKVTGEVFPETVLAVEETAQMILSPISNTATGDFAAVMAKASVLYRDFDADFADECLAAAEKAWDYLSAHKGDSGFKNVGDIVTGEYPDSKDADEYLWAAVELYLATGDSSYNDYAKDELENNKAISYGLGWADVGTYALYDYCKNVSDNETAKSKLKTAADRLTSNYKYSGYGSTISGSYVWGSNMVIANNGMLLLMASKILEDDSYVTYAHQQLDYLLGRNPVSYCFVTGFGSQSPTDTHHRPSQVLGEAMPGMLVGGADSNLEDPYAVAVLSDAANAKCYVDSSQSYSCNEVTIYWNSPLVYLLSSFK